MYRYETHCHTSEASRCGRLTGAELARFYRERGYDGIFVTDHFLNGSSAIDHNLPYEEQIELYFRGFEAAREEGAKIGLDVFFGVEFYCRATEFIAYCLDKQWMLDNPDLPTLEMREFAERAHAAGGFLVHAHPFRERAYIKTIRLYPDITDAVEIRNTSHPEGALFDDRAAWYAKSYGLPVTAGSDTHYTYKPILGGVEFKTKIEDERDYADRIIRGEGKIFEFENPTGEKQR